MSAGFPFSSVPEYLSAVGIACSAQQEEAILSGAQNTLLLAVPGSGKTTVLVSRIAQMLLFEDYLPAEIAAFTYNRAAAEDMSARFTELFGAYLPRLPRFSTLHSLCYSILRRYAAVYGRELPELLSGENGRNSPRFLLKQALLQQTKDYFSPEQLDEYLQRIGFYRNRMQEEEMPELPVNGVSLKRLNMDYAALKREQKRMDYDDMLTFALRVLNRLPQFAARMSAGWRWIFLDEAQDATKLQHQIISTLADGKRVFFVGDEDQTIYDFRGALPNELLSFSRAYENARLMRLEINYRCPREITESAKRLIDQNRNRYEKKMVSVREGSGAIHLKRLSGYEQQSDAVVEALAALPAGKTAAVVAAHNLSLLEVARKLTQRGVSYRRRDRDFGFARSFAVRGFLDLLQYAAAPKDEELFMAAARTLRFYRADAQKMAQRLCRYPNGFFAAKDCDISARAKKRAANAAVVLDGIKRQDGTRIFESVLYRLKYGDCLSGSDQQGGLPANCSLALYELRALAERSKDLSGYLRSIEQVFLFEKGAFAEGEKAITLSTVHGVKGLEFDRVILLDAVEGCFPALLGNYDSKEQELAELEAQRRLFYVALTRARESFTAYLATKYWGNPVIRSRFLLEAAPKSGQDLIRIRHLAFGDGEILSQENGIAQVAFARGIKTLQMDYCLKNGMIFYLRDESTGSQGKEEANGCEGKGGAKAPGMVRED